MSQPRVNARQIVFDGLMQMEDGGYSNIVLSNILENNALTELDKSFISRLFYGIIETKYQLDYYIEKFSKKKPDKKVKVILRMAIYQILHMHQVPNSAAVDEAVKLSKLAGRFYSGGFINGVLRTFLREYESIDLNKIEDDIKRLSVIYSCRSDIVEDLILDFGMEKTQTVLKNSIGQAPIYARVNTLLNTEDELLKELASENTEAEKTKFENAIVFSQLGSSFGQSKSFIEGKYHIQDLSSQLCANTVTHGLKLGIVLDMCAAPGGKSATMAQNMDDRGRVYSFDIFDAKVEQIRGNAKRLGLKSIIPSNASATEFFPEYENADRVLCDVPCSGIGVIAKKPEIKYKKREDYSALPKLQYEILENSSKYVCDGGILIYSTCTLFKVENEEVVEKFLENHPEFSPHPLPDFLDEVIDKHKHMATIFPDTWNSDGFFIATMIKN